MECISYVCLKHLLSGVPPNMGAFLVDCISSLPEPPPLAFLSCDAHCVQRRAHGVAGRELLSDQCAPADPPAASPTSQFTAGFRPKLFLQWNHDLAPLVRLWLHETCVNLKHRTSLYLFKMLKLAGELIYTYIYTYM